MEDWVIGIISGLSGGFLGFFASLLTLRFNYRSLFAQTVSQNRMDWINSFREELSIVVGAVKALKAINKPNNEVTNQLNIEELKLKIDAEKAKAKLLTRLNSNSTKTGNEYNEVFSEMLKKIQFDGSDDAVMWLEDLEDTAKQILESEWARVKKEAKGKYYGK